MGDSVITQRKKLWLILFYVLLLLPFCFLGYGSDNDTYRVLDAGRSTWMHHIAITSRNPGYWVYEAIVYCLTRVGGYVTSNLATLAIAVILLWRFLVIAARLGIKHSGLLSACLVATPVFAIACTSSMDYLWSLLALVLMVEALIAGKLSLAILSAAASFATRASSGMLIAGILAAAMVGEVYRSRRLNQKVGQLFGVGVAAFLIGCFPYVESYRLAGHTLQFLTPMGMDDPNSWTLKLRAGRLIYKGLYLFGPLAWLLFAVFPFLKRGDARSAGQTAVEYRSRAFPLFLGAVASNIILFFKFPLEISYLLPGALFFLLYVGATLLDRRRWMTLAVFLAIFSADLVTPQLLAPNIPNQATGAKFDPALISGQLIHDEKMRRSLMGCDTFACWNQLWGDKAR